MSGDGGHVKKKCGVERGLGTAWELESNVESGLSNLIFCVFGVVALPEQLFVLISFTYDFLVASGRIMHFTMS